MKCKFKTFDSEESIVKYLYDLQVDTAGINIIKNKVSKYNIEIRDIRVPAGLILKQEALSLGAEVAIPKSFIVSEDIKKTGTILLLATEKQLNSLISKIRLQQFGLDILSNQIKKILDTKKMKWFFSDYNLDCSIGKYHLMGIVNITPDSFYDGGKYNSDIKTILNYVEKQINDGADIIDVGGQSTRPGSEEISEEEEAKRVVNVIKEIKQNFSVPVSIDSYNYNVIKQCLDMGADIVNDITGLNNDDRIAELCKAYKTGLILMHMQGMPLNMQDNPTYDDLVNNIIDSLDNSIETALLKGANIETIVVDPGIGFGKTTNHNLEIIKKINEFKSLSRPVLLGLSNKSFIKKILDLDIDKRIIPTVASNCMAYLNGGSIFRVHNIKENKQALEIIKQINYK